MLNKKAQGMSTQTIILLILGLVVLVVLIIGFTLGWDKFASFIKPKSNVDDVSQACNTACSMDKRYDFCSAKKTLKTEELTLEDVTCAYLAKKQAAYFEDCPGIPCPEILSEAITEEGAKGDCTAEGDSVQYLKDNTLVSYTCLEEDIPFAE